MTEATEAKRTHTGLEIAVIGMAGRFPAAENIGAFWSNLLDGIDAISRLSEDELLAMGVAPETLKDDKYVPAKGVFPNIEYFDSAFFNYTPADATVLDPQVRALHEVTYHALEDAGYTAEGRSESVGLFLGATNNVAWESHTLMRYIRETGATFSGMQLNDKDFAATRIAYALGLRGPALTLHTACSTSLVAIDMACRNLWTGACQIALAGGSGLTLPHKNGYVYQENMIHSADGTCRAFDKDAGGTVEGNGAGVVALKRLETAVRDGDQVYAVIRGSAVNNDGTRKVGYTAPSIEGQAEVIRKAHRVAQITPAEVSYVETHGTGTSLGDPIEVQALRKAFGAGTPGTVGLGSLKSSIGHLDTAAGVASFIKTCKVLEQRTVPQSLHFSELNPNVSLDESPFYVAAEREELSHVRTEDGTVRPLRAGVSAFGIGGSNAHLVMEEAPAATPEAERPEGRAFNTFIVSAGSAEAIGETKQQFVNYLSDHPHVDADDLAWTLQNRQRRLPYRYAVEFSDGSQLRQRLQESLDDGAEPAQLAKNSRHDAYFLFSGLGAQHLTMARGLYTAEDAFRTHLDRCFAISEAMGNDVPREVFFGDSVAAQKQLDNIETTQVMLFMIEYSMAQTLIGWGLTPAGMIGHSTGELAAACVSGVFSLEDGIHLVHARGRLMGSTAEGTLTSVKAPEDTVRSMLISDLEIAAVNGPDDCTVSGSVDAVAAFEELCAEREIGFTHVDADHAYHSHHMQSVLDDFRAAAQRATFHPPQIPYVSNVSGTWITAEQATDPDYYCAHVRQTVQFKAGVETIMDRGDALFVEVGPGKSLSSFVRSIGRGTGVTSINMLRHRMEEVEDAEHLARSIKRLWEAGVALDWKAFHQGRRPKKVPLPLYPFDKIEYPVDVEEFQRLTAGLEGADVSNAHPRPRANPRAPSAAGQAAAQRLTWTESAPPFSAVKDQRRILMAFTDDPARLKTITDQIPHWRVVTITFGEQYEFHAPSGAVVRPHHEGDLTRLIADLEGHALVGDTFVVHRQDSTAAMALTRSLCAAVPGMQERCVTDVVVLDPANIVQNHDDVVPQLLGLNHEYTNVRVRAISCDTAADDRKGMAAWRAALRAELEADQVRDIAVRYENGRRLAPVMVPIHHHPERPAAGQRRQTVIVCHSEDVTDVLTQVTDSGPDRMFRVLPFHRDLGHIASAPMRGDDASDMVLPSVTGSTWQSLATRISARLRDLASVDEIVMWDTPSSTSTRLDRTDVVDSRKFHAAIQESGTARAVPTYIVSRPSIDERRWDADVTHWFVDNALSDAEGGPARIYCFSSIADARQSVFDLFPQMTGAGIRTAFHGRDPLQTQAEGKVVDADAGEHREERDAIVALLEHEVTRLLGFDEVNRRADIFDIGLDSVKLVQFTGALSKHGYKVVAGDVYNNPTIAGLADLINRTTTHTDGEGSSFESLAAALEAELDTPCSFQEFSFEPDADPIVLLFVDGLDDPLRKRVVRAINGLRPPGELVPQYILPRTLEDGFLANRDFASLGIGTGSAGQERTLESVSAEIERLQEKMRNSISAQPVKWRYPINGTQKLHFAGEVRLQLYLMQMEDLVDVEVLEQALRDVIGRHGLLRSFLYRSFGRFRWKEFEPPTTITLPQVDMSGWEPDRQEKMRSELVQREWNMDFKTVDKPMYHAVLVKYNERSYDILFQFDHSIFDVTSGQTFRSDLLQRYHQLMAGTTRAMPAARSFRHLKEQIDKGPVDITPNEIIEKFDLERYAHYSGEMQRNAAPLKQPEIVHARYSIDLSQLQAADGSELESFSTAVHLYARLVCRLIGVDHVALDLLFRSRVFEGTDYSDVMGMVLGSLPVVVSGERGTKENLRENIDEKTRAVDVHNISFFNLVQGLRSLIKYRAVNYRKVGSRDNLRTTCLFNFVGPVEDEYTAIWDMTMDQLTGEQDKLDYADCYGVAKISNGQLDLLVLTKWVEDPNDIIKILDEEVAHLMRSTTGAA